jgi:hypothetical protein
MIAHSLAAQCLLFCSSSLWLQYAMVSSLFIAVVMVEIRKFSRTKAKFWVQIGVSRRDALVSWIFHPNVTVAFSKLEPYLFDSSAHQATVESSIHVTYVVRV